jgi:peptidoglycan/xylan/chitin deacetylase (PgdA/CDA1 family)
MRGSIGPRGDRTRSTRIAPVTHGPRSARRVALTFDDGPGRVTESVLDVLARHGAAGTFNVLGGRIEGRERLLRRMVAEGHEVGNHGVDHRRLAGAPVETARQLARTNAAVRRAVGARPRIFRAPYGAVSRSTVTAAWLGGLVTVGWDVDPRDYETPGAAAIRERTIDAVRPGSVVLLHDDRRALEQTAVALDLILPDLEELGYELVTVSQLLGLRPWGRGHNLE